MEGQRVAVVAFAVLLAGLCVLSGLNAAPVECNNGGGIQISDDGYQSQTQTGPGCQTQTSEDGTQSQSQSQSGNGYQSQTQCSGSSCGQFNTFPPLFTIKPLEPLAPITWQPWGQMRNNQVQQQINLG
uniref:CG5773 protein n=1 Tax=Drosophila simulans TaxID=7240 RepID=A4VA14_DROSI|nr:CG5773 protein [Drosophila simulans]